ncbi:MAG: hypothetical protein QUS14_09715 [Pyrinomonadaceae bacterium]|jgi:hypothetical protein|nr:hypothetical protein [Pyrinomonadaceae bacterium]
MGKTPRTKKKIRTPPRPETRATVIETIQSRLSMPRVQISVILLITAFAGFACSAIMLRLGVTEMSLRYPVAVFTAYLIFLLLLRVWLWWQSEESIGDVGNIRVDGDLIAVAGDIDLPGSISSAADNFSFGGGGDFAGGGAGGAWSDGDTPSIAPVAFSSGSSSSFSSASSGGGGLPDIDVDLDEGVALILVVVILALVFSALIYVIWIAPVLLAELVIDAAVVGSLYKPVKNIERQHWLRTALRKTGIPALIIMLLFFFAGLVMQAAVPEAVTIGQFLQQF